MNGLFVVAFFAFMVIARACGVPDLGSLLIGAFSAVGITWAAERNR